METTIPFQEGLELGRSVDMRKIQAGDMLVQETQSVEEMKNVIIRDIRFVNTLEDVCDVFSIRPEYALKVRTGTVDNGMVRECMKTLGSEDAFTHVFKITFLQTTRTLHTVQIKSKKDESDSSTEHLTAQTGTDSGASSLQGEKTQYNGTHWVKAVEIGNELIIIVRMSAEGETGLDFLKIIKEKLKDGCNRQTDIDNLKDVYKTAEKIDKKLFRDKYIAHLDLAIYYCSHHHLRTYPLSFKGLVKTLECFVKQCIKWRDQSVKTGQQYPIKACSMTCKDGTYLEGKDTPEASSFGPCTDEGDHTHNLRVIVQSLETANQAGGSCNPSSTKVNLNPKGTESIFDKLRTWLEKCTLAERKMWDFLSHERFLLEIQTDKGKDVRNQIHQIHCSVKATIDSLDFVTIPSESSLPSEDPEDMARDFIESVTSKLPPGEQVDLMLIGKTGHGKSSTGNSILGGNEFKTSSSTTSETRTSRIAEAKIDGRTIKVVDAPGVYDTREDNEDLAIKAISDAITSCPYGFHALLLVFRFGIRLTNEEKKTILLLKRIMGKDIVRDYVICIWTNGDSFSKTNKKGFSDWCKSQKGYFKELFYECNGRCILFDNVSEDQNVRKLQLIQLIDLVDNLKRHGTRYTNHLFEVAQLEWQRIIEREEMEAEVNDEMHQYMEKMHQCMAGKDPKKEDLVELKEKVNTLKVKIDIMKSEQLEDVRETVEDLASNIELMLNLLDQPERVSTDTNETKGAAGGQRPGPAGISVKGKTSTSGDALDNKVNEACKEKASLQNQKDKEQVTNVVEKEVSKHNCFPGSSSVTLASGKCILMEELEIGDRVVVRNGKGCLSTDVVYMFGHKDPQAFGEFVVLKTATQSVSVTKGHYVYCVQDGKEICLAAEKVQCGDFLLTMSSDGLMSQPVMSICYERKRGLFAPFTLSGNFVVDQALMSCYIDVLPASTCHTLLWPVRQMYRLSPRVLAFVNGSAPGQPISGWAKFTLRFLKA